MMKNALIMFTLLIIVINCTNCQSKKSNNEIVATMVNSINNQYDSIRTFFEKEMIDHFPKNIDTTNIEMSWSVSGDFGMYNLEITNKYAHDTLFPLISVLESSCIAKYVGSDTCFLIPFRFLNKENILHRNDMSKSQIMNLSEVNYRSCSKSKYPVPNFWSNKFTSQETEWKLSNDFVLYVLDSKPGLYANNLKKETFMPDAWKNGFSKGVAVSENKSVVIYWLIIW